MNDLDTREWLLTNGLGGFASGTVCDARTRTYHGWLVAALEPPGQRTLLLSHLEASLEIGGQIFALGTNFWLGNKVDPLGYQRLRFFSADPVPTWIWGQEEQWELNRQIAMPYGLYRGADPRISQSQPQVLNRVLVQYRYSGSQLAILRLRPIIGDRDFHHTQQKESDLTFSQMVGSHQVFLQALRAGKAGTPWQLRWSQGHYQPEGAWYWSYFYPKEANRGLDYLEDLHSPGYLTVVMQPGDTLTLEARVGLPTANLTTLSSMGFDQTVLAKQQRLEREFLHLPHRTGKWSAIWERLLKASDQFIAYQTTSTAPSMIAGYHWFGDRSRETLLCIPGFTLTTKRYALARKFLDRLGRLCYQGLIPNEIPTDGKSPVFRSIDCSLWWIETLGLYLEATQDWAFLAEQYPIVKQIYKAFIAGTLHNIRVDAADGLVTWDEASVPLTWMDTMVAGQPVTCRHGKPIEINALWYSALCWASAWADRLSQNPTVLNADRLKNQARRYQQQAEEVNTSLQRYWNAQLGYLYDRIEPDDRLDPTIRPNAVLALSVYHSAFSYEQGQKILQVARDRLLTPYGLRTLDPKDPAYIGHYKGTPQQRDLAYHQGTVWSWLLGPFIRAWKYYYQGKEPLPLDLEPLLTHFSQQVCFGGISEIFDGDAPHLPGGAIAQASPIAELLRHWQDLELQED
ncbi:MAG: amylo-alpha-1,6-glucosidase [Kovacikia sp.]